MLEKLFQWCKGYVIIELCGNAKERFINLCKNKEIEIIHIFSINKHFFCKVNCRDYRKLRPMAEKTGCYPKIKQKCGLPFVLKRLKQRRGLVVGTFLFFAILLQCSGRIWSIEVEGGFLHTKEQMVRVLSEEMNIYGGVSIAEIDCFEIEKKLRLDYSEIGWISAERKGCRLHIMLNESVMPKLHEVPEEEMHIVADKDGIVRKIEVLRGVPQVKPGDEVKAGDVLISGIVPIVGDYEELIRSEVLCAQGSVYIESEFLYSDDFPMSYEVKNVLEERSGLEIFLFRRKLFSYIPRYSEGKYDIMSIDIVPYVFRDYKAPVLLRKYRCFLYETEQVRLSSEEAKEKAQQRFQVLLDDWEIQGVEIIASNLKIQDSLMRCKAEGTITACGNFISYREILEEEWKIKDEYSGDNP